MRLGWRRVNSTARNGQDHLHSPNCMICGHNKPFDLPNEIIEAALNQSLVIFAGAGISTEVPAVFSSNIYSTIKARVTDYATDEFPDVMTGFVEQHGRTKLVEEIWKRFDYIRSFSELRRTATRFHRQLATMPYITDIITTNWDPYFEEECGAIPIVTGADYGLRDLNARRVYKIHGSINAISTIVATRKDYDDCLEVLRENALGATLRHLLATRVVVFSGYSLTDADFSQIYEALTADLGEFAPTRYFVAPFESSIADKMGMKQIITDGTYFLSQLKSALIDRSHYVSDSVYDKVREFQFRLAESSGTLDAFVHTKLPGLLFCYFYQQGARHACDRILANRIRGEYSDAHIVQHKAHSYHELLEGAFRNEMYLDAAYIEGYLGVLLIVLAEKFHDTGADEDVFPPSYFCFSNRDLHSVDDFERSARNLRRRNRPAWDQAKKLSDLVGPDYIPQHDAALNYDELLAE